MRGNFCKIYPLKGLKLGLIIAASEESAVQFPSNYDCFNNSFLAECSIQFKTTVSELCKPALVSAKTSSGLIPVRSHPYPKKAAVRITDRQLKNKQT